MHQFVQRLLGRDTHQSPLIRGDENGAHLALEHPLEQRAGRLGRADRGGSGLHDVLDGRVGRPLDVLLAYPPKDDVRVVDDHAVVVVNRIQRVRRLP